MLEIMVLGVDWLIILKLPGETGFNPGEGAGNESALAFGEELAVNRGNLSLNRARHSRINLREHCSRIYSIPGICHKNCSKGF
jgi:hypothetical protein